jgi:AhpD family alkylhydroperoxidase
MGPSPGEPERWAAVALPSWASGDDPPRVPRLTPGDLDGEQRRLYERITRGPRGREPARYRLTDEDGALTGPFGVVLLSPRIGTALTELGEAIRFGGGLPPRMREIAILVVAAARRCAYEWYVHAAAGQAAGLKAGELQALATAQPVTFPDGAEQAAHDLSYRAVRREPVDDALWERATGALGHARLVELLILVGYYETLALLLDTARVGAPVEH